MSAIPGVPPNITLLTGPLLLGYLFNYGLYGILAVQVYLYYLFFPKDSRYTKALVYTLFSLDTIQTVLTTHNAWHFLSEGWGNPAVLRDPGWSWISIPLFSGIVAMAVQIFFAWRIHVISRGIWLPAIIVVLALAEGFSACAAGIWFAIVNDITKITDSFPVAVVWLAGSAVCDIIISVQMVYFLYQARTKTTFGQTDALITRLITLTVETGTITASAAAIEIFLFLYYQDNNLHIIPALMLAKLYTNTLMATLNSRSPAFKRGFVASQPQNQTFQWRSTGPILSGTESTTVGTTATAVRITRHTMKDDADMGGLKSASRAYPMHTFNEEDITPVKGTPNNNSYTMHPYASNQ